MDMDRGQFYFIEVNPRVQVEHTVTEEVTGIDIVQAQILIAEGATLAEATGGHLASRDQVARPRHAMPHHDGRPAEQLHPRLWPSHRLSLRPRGQGIRLDGGTAYAGGVVTRHYDSLLVKVIALAQTPQKAIARLDRALREFRIRGLSTNIAFVENLLKHPTFLDDTCTTKFIDTTPDLFAFKKRRDRATKILTYIADITVNGHPETVGRQKPPPQRPTALRAPEPRSAPRVV